MNIVFFGSGDFAEPLISVLEQASLLRGIVVASPKPAGRGRKPAEPDVLHWARERGITVFAPERPNERSFIDRIRALKPDMLVLASYGHILGRELLDTAANGGLNIHPSLLPRYRGAAPIQRALMDGASRTGITIILMDEKIDHGKIVFQKAIDIAEDDTYGSLMKKLSALAATHLIGAIENVSTGNYTPIVQDESRKSHAPKIRKEEMNIHWCSDPREICNKIRALSPAPGAKTIFRGEPLAILGAEPAETAVQPGCIHVNERRLLVGASSGSVIMKRVRPQSRSIMTARDFINGYRPREGEKLG